MLIFFFFFNDTATTEIYTSIFVGSDIRRGHLSENERVGVSGRGYRDGLHVPTICRACSSASGVSTSRTVWESHGRVPTTRASTTAMSLAPPDSRGSAVRRASKRYAASNGCLRPSGSEASTASSAG